MTAYYSQRIDIESLGYTHRNVGYIYCLPSLAAGAHSLWVDSYEPLSVSLPIDFDGEVIVRLKGDKEIRFPIDPHPWLEDVQAYARMLSGQISIPHLIYKRKLVDDRGCDICIRAKNQMLEYLSKKTADERVDFF